MREDFTAPREVEIQWTEEYARSQSDEDEDSYDEDSCSDVDWQIGQSREIVELDSWSDMPAGYEPVNESDAYEYDEYLNNKDYDDE